MNVLVLHGFSMNGGVMERALASVAEATSDVCTLRCLDAPHVCPPDAVDRLYAVWNRPRLPPPYLTWFDATDDGRVYRGWDESVPVLEGAIAKWQPRVVLGFSQGAVVATALAAFGERTAFPRLGGVILIAGRTPRSDVLAPLVATPLATHSLHVWGVDDVMVREESPKLVTRFEERTRTVVTCPGAHEIPETGPGRDAVVDFLRRIAAREHYETTAGEG